MDDSHSLEMISFWLSPLSLVGAIVICSIVLSGVFAVPALRKRQQLSSLPRPASTHWLWGNTLDAMNKQGHRMHDWFLEQSEQFNGRPWLLSIVGRPPTVIVAGPDYYEAVLKTHVDVFLKGEVSLAVVKDFFGEGILAVDGPKWFFHRKTASHLFSLQMMKSVMHDVIREKTLRLREVLTEHAQQRLPFGLKDLLCQFTSEVFAKVGFGIEINCLRGPEIATTQSNLTPEERQYQAEIEEFIDALATCNRLVLRRSSQPMFLWKLKRWLNVGEEKEFKKSLDITNMWTTRIIEASMAAKNQPNVPPAKDLISLFLDSKIDRQVNVQNDVQLIRDMVVNFVFAGKDTTSQAMSWYFVMMNKYPHVVAKLREELDAKLPGLRDGSVGVPSMEDLKELVYLEATIKENLRINPAVPASTRTAMQDVVLHEGTCLPAGTRVLLSSYATGRLKSIWGDDALEFKPERWIDEKGQLIAVSPFKFQAFLAGPRICLGIKFAMLEMKMVLAVLISAFDIRLVQNPDDVKYEVAITLAVNGPLPATVTIR